MNVAFLSKQYHIKYLTVWPSFLFFKDSYTPTSAENLVK